MIKFGPFDAAVVVVGILLVFWGEINDVHGAIFAGAAWLGSFVYKLGAWWTERREMQGDK